MPDITPADALAGHARWLTPNTAAVLTAGGECELEIQTVQKRTSRRTVYRVEQHVYDGRVQGYRMSRTQGKPQAYFLALGTDGQLFCECPDSRYRTRPGSCRHVVGLTVALRQIGLLEPEKETP